MSQGKKSDAIIIRVGALPRARSELLSSRCQEPSSRASSTGLDNNTTRYSLSLVLILDLF